MREREKIVAFDVEVASGAMARSDGVPVDAGQAQRVSYSTAPISLTQLVESGFCPDFCG